jgi:hypothetical protein
VAQNPKQLKQPPMHRMFRPTLIAPMFQCVRTFRRPNHIPAAAILLANLLGAIPKRLAALAIPHTQFRPLRRAILAVGITSFPFKDFEEAL